MAQKKAPKPSQSSLDDLLGSGPDLGGLAAPMSLGADMDMDALLAGPQEPLEDPLAGIDYTGDLEKDASLELTELEQAYRDRAKNEANRFKTATDSEFWVAVCFKSRADKEKFLRDNGLDVLGDKYIDGHRAGSILKDRRR